jgi:hypothetical protein
LKIHFQEKAFVSSGYSNQAEHAWKREGLVPWLVRSCDQLMVLETNKKSLTNINKFVTCKHCIKKIN